jgi:flavin reductase (DIM6/NTAB) family NADH-FMN oxidoreductase RutF
MDCTIEQIHEAGDHWIVVGRVEEMDVEPRESVGPLLFFSGGYGKFTA